MDSWCTGRVTGTQTLHYFAFRALWATNRVGSVGHWNFVSWCRMWRQVAALAWLVHASMANCLVSGDIKFIFHLLSGWTVILLEGSLSTRTKVEKSKWLRIKLKLKVEKHSQQCKDLLDMLALFRFNSVLFIGYRAWRRCSRKGWMCNTTQEMFGL